jgi:hypothetical protein
MNPIRYWKQALRVQPIVPRETNLTRRTLSGDVVAHPENGHLIRRRSTITPVPSTEVAPKESYVPFWEINAFDGAAPQDRIRTSELTASEDSRSTRFAKPSLVF